MAKRGGYVNQKILYGRGVICKKPCKIGGVWPKGCEVKGEFFEASTNSSAEEHAPEKTAGEVEKIGLISSEKIREEAMGKDTLL